MAIILNIETSTTVCSVSIGINGIVSSVKEVNEGYSHAEKLEQLIQSVLKDAGIEMKDLQAVSVSKGPGSYTGLRIGVSLAKGICYGAEIPLVSVPTLEAMALDPKLAYFKNANLVPMLDARRMEVYACVLSPTYEVLQATSAIVVDENSFATHIEQSETVFFGPGMSKCQETIGRFEKAIFQQDVLPSSAFMVSVSERKFNNQEFENMAYFEPFYLKDFVAGKPKKLL
ncbi:MAG: tRNA threonylcarbamoyladenosine biosynthesis protein TsaB [Salibacteraceae bacterium]|jgi:tRNA threonylcarbamoyladenosine biosynthesis protein TsaB